MSPELHRRVRKLFDEALERPESERTGFLKIECSGDEEAFAAVVRLLEAYQPAQSFLEDRPQGMERIGRYLITGELGRGSMGVVYEAVDPLIGRNVAVKVIHVEALADPGKAQFLRERLFREARSAGQLFHPGIVTVLDVGQEGELAFIAMELVDGLSLQRTLVSDQASGEKLEQARILDILRQTAAALDFAHRNKVVHCDVKPGNIMLGRNQESGGVVKLTDFGIAKIASTQYHTRTGLLMGTPSYMSPEQIEAHPVDGKSDQFSLAVVAFELLTGAVPFRAESLAGLAHTIVYGPTPSARTANPQLPEGVDAILDRALAKSPEDRFPSCTEFVGELEMALSGVPPLPAHRRSKKVLAISIAGGLAVAIAAAGVYRYAIQPQVVPSAFSKPAIPSPAPPPAAPAATNPGGRAPEPQPRVSAATIYNQGVAELKAGHPDKALPLFRQAADLGDTHAMLELGNMFEYGEGVEKNYAEAKRWLSLAADRGSPEGMRDLGGLYFQGMGRSVPPDYAAAVLWFERAANNGEPDAKYDLGTMYELGLGVAKEPDKATQLYRDAAKLGNEEAKKRLAR
jgi:hypothetical protein